ncbi:hypothetical protein SISNIDRAFT_491311 [Sistotremastrum niveocremeum HHB9708]|uniref:Uncharacterized protein n=1 Tax=Sistotremastrum niveocremeum HHB9708 TaxID=1314777 RepID=A0A164MY94_9AGAM|nr:hypothetical protein SISNIDRAFT_491311 [Sistotremastrum niveocremeum HHB9708]
MDVDVSNTPNTPTGLLGPQFSFQPPATPPLTQPQLPQHVTFTPDQAPALPAPVVHRHETYMDEKDLYCFEAVTPEGEIYRFRLPIRWLANGSEPLQSLLTLAQGDSGEGRSEVNPIKLPDPSDQWAAFAMWSDRQEDEFTLKEWTALLALSSKYFMEKAKKDAVRKIEDLHLPASTLLRYCIDYKVETWFIDSVKEVTSMELRHLSGLGPALGMPIFSHILALKGIRDHSNRSLLVCTFSQMTHLCHAHQREDCQRNFDDLLRQAVSGMLHPDTPLSPEAVQRGLENHRSGGHHIRCFANAIDLLKERRWLYGNQTALKERLRDMAEEFGFSDRVLPETF